MFGLPRRNLKPPNLLRTRDSPTIHVELSQKEKIELFGVSPSKSQKTEVRGDEEEQKEEQEEDPEEQEEKPEEEEEQEEDEEEDDDEEDEEEEYVTKFREHPMVVLSGVQLPVKLKKSQWAYTLSKVKAQVTKDAQLIKLLKWMGQQDSRMVSPTLILYLIAKVKMQVHCSLHGILPIFSDQAVEALCALIATGVLSLVILHM